MTRRLGSEVSKTATNNEPSLRQSAAKGSAVTLVAQVLRILLQLLSVILLARLISPNDFGLLAMTLAVCSVATIFLDSGFSMSALRSKELTQQQHSNLFWINTGAGVTLTIIVFLLATPIALFFEEPRLVAITQWISIIYFFGGLTAQHRVSLNRAMRFKALAVADVVSPLLALIFAFVLASNGYGITALIVQQISAAMIMLILSIATSRWIPNLPRATEGMKPLLRFGIGFAATRALSYLTQNVDSIAIGRVSGPIPLGLYDRAYRIAIAPVTQISFPMTRIAMPVLTRVVDDSKLFISALREAQLIGTYATSSLLLVLSGVASPAVAVLFGPEWMAAAPILSILCISAVFRTVQQVANWVMIAKGLAGSLLKFNLIMQPIVVLFTVAGVHWGPIGVATGSAIGYAIYWVSSIAWAGRSTNLNLWPLLSHPLKVICIFSLPSGMIAFAISYLFDTAPILQLTAALFGAVLWFGVTYLISGFVRRDLKKLARFVSLAIGR